MHINQQGQHVYKTKPKRCPNCASKAIADYFFGFPGKIVFEDQLLPELQQKYQVGGCEFDMGEYIREWNCKACGTDFYMKNNSILSME